MMSLTSCDTFAAQGPATADGGVILAKNSDRPEDERQRYVLFDGARHPKGTMLRVQYMEIPQAPETYRVVGAQPLWLWGFEHGVNEWGVAIGNEAIYTKADVQKVGLLGMDLVRIGLERARTAKEAVDIIGRLVEQYGIGGSAREHDPYYYDNGFLIADPNEVWHLETVGRHWVARKVTEPVYAISNEPSIGDEWDAASPGLADYLHCLAPSQPLNGLHFAHIVLDRNRPRGQATCRRARGLELLQRDCGRLTTEHMLALLRDHYDGTAWAKWDPAELDVKSICMHSTPYHPVKTAGSMVAHLHGEPGQSLLWLAVGQPCQRIFLPYRMAELTDEQALDATQRVEVILEELFEREGRGEDPFEGEAPMDSADSTSAEITRGGQLVQTLRDLEKALIDAVRDSSVPLATLRAQTTDRLERLVRARQ